MFKAMQALQAMPSWKVLFPVFFLVAGMERVVDRKQSKSFYDKTQAPLKDFIDFAAFYHEIFHEKNRRDAFRVLNGCIDKIRKTR
jgi:alpha-beta hydrolase superfamily lysophospholipase